MKTSFLFIIVDDDEADDYIAKRIIKKMMPDAGVTIFTDAQKALDFIKTEYVKPEAHDTILFVDITMQLMSGWKFLDLFEMLEDKIKQFFTIYLLSYMDDDSHKDRVRLNKRITASILKPLSEESLLPVILNRKKKTDELNALLEDIAEKKLH